MNDENSDSIFFCSKCKKIPLIQLSLKSEKIDIFSSCHCRKQIIPISNFMNNYYKSKIKNINIDNENEKKAADLLNNKSHLETIINKYETTKINILKKFLSVKNEAIEFFKKQIQKVEEIYTKNKEINTEIDKIIQLIINNYKLLPNNYSNIQNLICNLRPNLNYNRFYCINNYSLMKEIEKYYKDNYIISEYNENQLKLIKSISDIKNDKIYIQINKSLLASKYNDRFINIFEINGEKGIQIEAHKNESINCLIINENLNLISVGNSGLIKIWPRIINIKIYYNENDDSQKNINKYKSIEISPIIEIKLENNIKKIVSIMEKLIIVENSSITLLSYDINNKEIHIINKIKLIISNLINIKTKFNKDLICACDTNKIIFLNIPELEKINEIKVSKRYCSIICLETLNESEIIVGTENYLKIININNFQIKLVKNIGESFLCIKKLKDGTLLVGLKNEIKRFSLKNMKELPTLLQPKEKNSDIYDYEDYYGPPMIINVDGYGDFIFGISEIDDGKIMVIFRYKVDIYQFLDM